MLRKNRIDKMIINRDFYLKKLISKRHSPYIKIITGIRRCGKSYLLKKLYCDYLYSQGVGKDQIIVVELDDDAFEKLRNKEKLREYIENKASNNNTQYYIIIDEVQMIDGFEGTIISLNNHDNYDVYITGSNSKFLSKDISTLFKDRGTEIHIHPLSYEEFYKAYNGDKHFALNEYLTYGGMPYLISEPDESEKVQYLNNLIKKTYISDIVERNDVRHPEELDSLFDVLCSVSGSLVNPTSIAGTMQVEKHTKIDSETVFTYMGYFEDSFLFEKSKRYDIKGKAYLNTPFKFYPEDIGLRNARLNFRQVDNGFGIETVVYNELRKRGYLVDVGLLETRERNEDGKQIYKQKEVDFIARFASNEYYLQVMNELPTGQHGLNEYDNLKKVPGAFKKIAIINSPLKAFTDENGILNISLEDFLLDQDSLKK